MAIPKKYQGFGRTTSTTNPLSIFVSGQERVDFGNATLTQAGADSAALLFGLGTATTRAVTGTADTKFISFYLENSATSGDNRGIYNRFYLSGAGGGGESLRSYTEIAGVAAGTAHGAHISLGTGESTTVGTVTGLGVAVRATLGLANGTVGGGTYAALMPEIYSFGSSSAVSGMTELSFIRCTVGGDATGGAAVEDKAYLLVVDGILTATSNMIQASTTETNYSLGARCKLNGVDAWMMFASAAG